MDIILENGWDGLKRVVLVDFTEVLEGEVVVLEEIFLGMNSRSFELLFILRWEIAPLFRIK